MGAGHKSEGLMNVCPVRRFLRACQFPVLEQATTWKEQGPRGYALVPVTSPGLDLAKVILPLQPGFGSNCGCTGRRVCTLSYSAV